MNKSLSLLAAPGFFRLALSLIVFVNHVSRFNIGPGAVLVFFILSGYWIQIMWAKKYSHSKTPYLTYIVSRMWRIYPVFLLCTVITWILLYVRHAVPLIDDPIHQAFSNIFMLGYHSLGFMPDIPAWSLDMELQFYLIAPFLIFLFSKNPWYFLPVGVLSLCAAVIDVTGGLATSNTVAPYVLFFGVGLVVARGRWRPGAVLGWTSLLATGALIVLILLSPYRGVIMDGVNPDAPLHVWNVPICALLALVLAPWALYTTQQKGSSLDPMFADLSYIVYLLHFPVLDVFNNGGGVSLRHLVEVSETFVITMVGSVLIWRYVDRPLNRLRTRWVAARLVPDARSRRVGEALA